MYVCIPYSSIFYVFYVFPFSFLIIIMYNVH